MSAPEQRFQSFITRVRPHRVAVLTNIADPYWQESCLGILEYFTKLWGGSHCIIIPTDGTKIDEIFWTVLSAYDPDSIYRYERTGADERIRDQAAFDKVVAATVTNEAKQAGCPEEQIHAGIEEALLKAPFDEWNVSGELRDELLMRLAPFHFQKMPLHGMPDRQLNVYSITRGSKPGHPHTAITDILKASAKPVNVVQIVRDVDDTVAPPPLWLASTIGSGDSTYFAEMEEVQVPPTQVLMSKHRMSQIIKWGVSPRASLELPFPFAVTGTALTAVMAVRARRFELPTVIVIGDTVQDFCLYQALYWLHGRAAWLPSWFMPQGDGYPERLMTVIREAESNAKFDHNQRLSFVSFSVQKNDLDGLKQQIHNSFFRTLITIDVITQGAIAPLLKFPSRIFAEGNLGDVTTHLLYNENLPGAFESPLPRKISPVRPQEHRWLVDITFIGHLVPRHPDLGRIIVTDPNVGDVRSGKEAVSYMCPGGLVMGNHMETNMLRPSIHVPDAAEIFRIVLEDCDYESKTSDKGRYEEATVRKFGGLDKVGHALWSGTHRMLLLKFLDKAAGQKGVTDEGAYLKDGRRYLDFSAVNKIMQSDRLSYELIDEYVERGIFYRGYVFICEDCSDSAWHSISEVDQTFMCRRCGLKQQYKHQHWKMPNEPLWYYKLDEMIYLMLHFNGHVPLLTLNKLRTKVKDSFLFRSELRLTPKGSHKTYLEMDICCVADGKLCIGEAKSNGDLSGKELTALQIAERYRNLALKIGASVVVFSTTAVIWNDASRTAIEATFAPCPHIELRQITGAHLLG